MKKQITYILLLLVVLGLQGCSSRKKNNATTRAYHAFFAKYNTFYNGSVAFNQGHKAQLAGHTDNYLELLPLLITSNENTQNIGSTNFDRAIEKAQKAIKNHSIKRKPRRDAGKKLTEIESLDIYVKPQEGKAYYVVNKEIEGKVDLF